jgi:hypothetical protein
MAYPIRSAGTVEANYPASMRLWVAAAPGRRGTVEVGQALVQERGLFPA